MPRRKRFLQPVPMVDPLEPRQLLAIDPASVPAPVFHVAPGEEIRAVLAADLTGDAKSDLAVAAGNRIVILRNRGDGAFRRALSVTLPDGLSGRDGRNVPAHLIRGDFNGDGLTDLVVGGVTFGPGGRTFSRTWLLVGSGNGQFTPAPAVNNSDFLFNSPPRLVVDTNADRVDEILGPDLQRFTFGPRGRILSSGTVADQIWSGFKAPIQTDIDGDGDLDILASRGATVDGQHVLALTLLRNTDTGFRLERIADDRVFEATPHDLTGDGLPELLFTTNPGDAEHPSVRLNAIANIGGSFVGDPVTLYEESHASIRARGGHGPQIPAPYRYNAELAFAGLGQKGGDDRPDVLLNVRSAQFWAARPGSSDFDSFSENYGVALIAADPARPADGGIPTFTVLDIDPIPISPIPISPRPITAANQLALADFDGDGLDDRVLVHNFTPRSGTDIGGREQIFIDFRSAARPLARRAATRGDGSRGAVTESGTLSIKAYFRPADRPGASPIAEVNVFLDTNHNRRLDASDLRIGVQTAADPSNPSLFRLTLRRRPAWGSGVTAVFLVAEDIAGTVSSPLPASVRLL